MSTSGMLNQENLVIDPVQLKQRLQSSQRQDPFLLDVQEPEEYNDWRIEGSVNIPLANLSSPRAFEQLPKEREIVTVCALGRRSANAALYLRQVGFNARSLNEGLVGWSRVYDIAPLSATKDSFKLLQIRRIGKGCTSYMLCSGKDAAVIDPTVHINEYTSLATREDVRVRHVIDTHLHADHVSGARALSKATGALLHLNPLEQFGSNGFAQLNDGGRIPLGDITIEVIHTPGHTKGSTSFLIAGKYLLTGDTLFVEALARPDLHQRAEEFAHDLFITYRKMMAGLPGDVLVLPAHFSRHVSVEFGTPFSSTLAAVRQKLPEMEAAEPDFIQYVLGNIPPKPPSYEKVLRINRAGTQYNLDEVDELEQGPNRCALRI